MGEAVRSAGEGQALPDGPITYEAFLAGYDGVHAEWVEGWVVPMSPITGKHDELVLFLAGVLDITVRRRRLGVVRHEPFQMKPGPDLPGRSPDLLFVAAEHLDRVKETFLDGPADLVVEVISPDSRRRDRVDKFHEYERGGVREYWLLDPEQQRAEFFQLGDDGAFQAIVPDAQGVYRLAALPELWLSVAWLWEQDAGVVFKAWGVF